jgi:hypothetical protein
MQRPFGWQLLALLLLPSWTAARAPVEELPPPSQPSVLTRAEPTAGNSPVSGWGLFGASGRYYFVGEVALADYARGGERQIVPLIKEDPASHAKPDPNFLYYREETAGHRWAIRRQAAADRRYSIYFQPADAPGAWQLFERALGSWDDVQTVKEAVAESSFIAEPACGCSHSPSTIPPSVP